MVVVVPIGLLGFSGFLNGSGKVLGDVVTDMILGIETRRRRKDLMMSCMIVGIILLFMDRSGYEE